MNITPLPNSVLVVDDNKVNRQLARAFLEKDGWVVSEADNGENALAALQANAFRAILLDISMPGQSGIEILLRLRQLPQHQHMHAVAYTAHALEEEKRRILDAGFDDLLIKPISKAAMAEIFGKIWNKNQ